MVDRSRFVPKGRDLDLLCTYVSYSIMKRSTYVYFVDNEGYDDDNPSGGRDARL